MKCKICGAHLKEYGEEGEGKDPGYIGRSGFCKEHWTMVKRIIQRSFEKKEKLAKRWGLKPEKVSRIIHKDIQNRGEPWNKKDVIRQVP
ncbi:MAG: hypothetical protein ABEK36_04550 [Candidatus Aenigmatarchaeota archaeon]